LLIVSALALADSFFVTTRVLSLEVGSEIIESTDLFGIDQSCRGFIKIVSLIKRFPEKMS
jgi:hypothetical protein